MGYFSNGTEGEAFISKYCDHCLHNYGKMMKGNLDGDDVHELCPVWQAHLEYNYEDCNNEKSILHILIPRDKEGLWNEDCRMFVDRRQKARTTQLELIHGRRK